ncbi:MAG TPA: lysine 2,3-aminomutase, partial [Isosphaeraceae bacterium]|nr:lysine 2,3-aminomutase [Isosphaeraceae bacterium]
GAGHFRTPVWKGIEIIEGLRGHISGLGVPTYVVDAPRGGGKIPLMPNYLISASNDSVVLRNYEGMLIHYHPTGAPPERRAPVETQGVSGLLEGRAEVLVPEGNARLLRRRSRIAVNGNGEGLREGLANGDGNGKGRGKRGLTP